MNVSMRTPPREYTMTYRDLALEALGMKAFEAEFRLIGFYWYFEDLDEGGIAEIMNKLRNIYPLIDDRGRVITYDQQMISAFVDVVKLHGRPFPQPVHLALCDIHISSEHMDRECQEYYQSRAGQGLLHSHENTLGFQGLLQKIARSKVENPDISQSTVLWYIMNLVYCLLRAEHIKTSFVDISVPRSWPNWFRDEFLKAVRRCSEDPLADEGTIYEELRRDLNNRKDSKDAVEPPGPVDPFAIIIDYDKMYLPTSPPNECKMFEQLDIQRAVCQFSKWGFIRGELAESWIRLDGRQLDLANSMIPGAAKDKALAEKRKRQQIHGSSLPGSGVETVPDSP